MGNHRSFCLPEFPISKTERRKSMNKVTIYRYDENKPMRTLNLNGEPWFVLRDVCEV